MYNRYTNSIFNFYLPLNCHGLLQGVLSGWRNGPVIPYPWPQWTLRCIFSRTDVVKCCGAVYFSCGRQFTGTAFWEQGTNKSGKQRIYSCFCAKEGIILAGREFFGLLSTERVSSQEKVMH